MSGAKKPRLPITEALYRMVKRQVIRGYHQHCESAPTKRALLSYLVHPLLLPSFLRDPAQFSNQGIAREIPRALNELGYAVDIVDYSNTEWQPEGRYDLFIGHTNHNFTQLASQVRPAAKVVYFATGVHWRQWNTEEAKRLYEVALRRGTLLPPERISDPNEGEAYAAADAIISLGNRHAANSFGDYPNVFNIDNAAYRVENVDLENKDFVTGRNHFLFFSGLGNVHKGLDLLLEAFAGTSLHLHVCQHIQTEFARAYRREFAECSNIHLHGFVKMRTPAFEQLAGLCSWVTFPTCAEGQPGSVIECMAYGLVPILSDAANIDLEDWGYRIDALTVESVRAAITKASCTDVADCRARSEKVAQWTRTRYSPEAFRKGFRDAVEQIIAVSNAT